MSLPIHQTLSQLASQCVMCGLCIPHCPTYHLFRTENESPRGRIALYKALAEEQLNLSPGLAQSLNHCLGCQACEAMCPSQVNYTSITLLGRELIAMQNSSSKQPVQQKLAEQLLITPTLHPLIKVAAKAIAPIQQFISHISGPSTIKNFTRAIADDTSTSPALKKSYPVSAAKAQVILFKGCSGDLFEQQALTDSAALLNACGFNVVIPEKHHCCGAIKMRNGDTQGMIALARQTINNFSPYLSESRAIISLNNSCSGQLKGLTQLSSYSDQKLLSGANEFTQKTSDIIAFLLDALNTSKIRLAPLHQKVLVHIPCSLKNHLKEERLLWQLLSHIPSIQLKKLNDKFCCGAAGSYMLHYPDVANRLLDDKIEEIKQHIFTKSSTNCSANKATSHSKNHAENTFNSNMLLIVSSNLSCTLHFKQGLEKQGLKNVAVIHPVRLLARQLSQKD